MLELPFSLQELKQGVFQHVVELLLACPDHHVPSSFQALIPLLVGVAEFEAVPLEWAALAFSFRS